MSDGITDIIKKRYSVRTYSKKRVAREKLDSLKDYLAKEHKAPFCSKTRFKLITTDASGQEGPKRIGTYGFIKNAPFFIAGTVKRNGMYLEDYGYIFEKIILKATEMGLGTCWLGGTFKRSDFISQMHLSEEEELPAVTPVGYESKKTSVRDKVVRGLAKSDRRYDWDKLFFIGKDPLSREEASDYGQALEMVRIAPSSSNNQPWRIYLDKNKESLHFYMKVKTRKDVSYSYNLKRLDIGIAMSHFDLAIREKGITGTWIIDDNKKAADTGQQGIEYRLSWKRD